MLGSFVPTVQAQSCPTGQVPTYSAATGAPDGGCQAAPAATPTPTQTATTPTATPAGACGANCNLPYVPLEPIPGLTDNPNLTSPNSLPEIINAIFVVFITVGALLAVLMLTVGGIQYMVSGSAVTKSGGLKRAQAALWGIVLLSASWLILHTINPALLKFNLNPCPAGTPAGTTGCTPNPAPNPNTATTGSGTTASGGTGTGSSATPLVITVTPLNAYSADSDFAQQNIVPGLGAGTTLVNTSSGSAVAVANNNNLSNPTIAASINNFSQQCTNAQGSVGQVAGSSQTIFFCMQQK